METTCLPEPQRRVSKMHECARYTHRALHSECWVHSWHILSLCQQLVCSAEELDGYEAFCEGEDQYLIPVQELVTHDIERLRRLRLCKNDVGGVKQSPETKMLENVLEKSRTRQIRCELNKRRTRY